MIFCAATQTSARTPHASGYGLRARVTSWGKPRIKQVLITGYCWGVLPMWLVAWAFKRWGLANE